MGGKRANRFYAWAIAGEEGVVESWAECEAQVRGRPNARYKGFATRDEAQGWLAAGAPWGDEGKRHQRKVAGIPDAAVYFDSGTGRGAGTEVNVTDRDGVPLAHLVVSPARLTPQGTVLLTAGRTNNYGELLACLLGIRAARKLGLKTVCGDSRLVLDYWSKGHVSTTAKAADPDVARLAALAATERAEFESDGGVLRHVKGGLNPADLGFHRD
ncbi:MAG: ribonuclease H family protein [Deltaproteobacteria bacterium]|nr:ribonuclease H family protein [Deltaproteobacteria bacterium]